MKNRRKISRAWKIILLLGGIIVGFYPNFLQAQVGLGGYPEAYLRRDVGARATGLGGAYSAVGNEPAGMYYNPASLGFMSHRPQFSTMYTKLDFSREHNFLAYGQTFDDFFGVGAYVNNFYAGSFVPRNGFGEPIAGDYFNQQLALGGAFSFKFSSFSLGVGAKYLTNSLRGSGIKGEGWGLDVGAKIQAEDILTIGISAQNVGGEMKWNNAGKDIERIPYTIRGGVAAEFGFNAEKRVIRSNTLGQQKVIHKKASAYALLTLEAVYNRDDAVPKVILGGEITPMEFVAFRAGMPLYSDNRGGSRFLNFNEYAIGLTLNPYIETLPFQFRFDYSAALDYLAGADGLSHHLSVILEF